MKHYVHTLSDASPIRPLHEPKDNQRRATAAKMEGAFASTITRAGGKPNPLVNEVRNTCTMYHASSVQHVYQQTQPSVIAA